MNLNAQVIRQRQRQLGISLRELAARTGISLPWLTRIRDGEPNGHLTIRHLERLATTLACNPADLLTDPDDEPTTNSTQDDVPRSSPTW